MRSIRFIAAFLVFPTLCLAADNLGEFIVHHVANTDNWHPLPGLPGIHLPSDLMLGPVPIGISLHVIMVFLAAAILSFGLTSAARRKEDIPTSRLGHLVEAIVIFLRDQLIVPNIGKKDAPAWTPFFCTIFFFLLTLNLLGLVPGMGTATSNVNFTAAMAIMVFLVFNLSGMAKNGSIGYFTNLIPKGVPAFVLPILAPIELIGIFTKAFALAIRLFANMVAGHFIIISLLGLISVFKGAIAWVAVAPSVGFTLFIYCIELLVAFLQAFIFTLLSTLFVGMAIHQDH